ncbi:unnamed protein product [Pedinophyceae sp. YPF-701]|nr:unnamed protein product [Pedinophyceae sp. YPF-701]
MTNITEMYSKALDALLAGLSGLLESARVRAAVIFAGLLLSLAVLWVTKPASRVASVGVRLVLRRAKAKAHRVTSRLLSGWIRVADLELDAEAIAPVDLPVQLQVARLQQVELRVNWRTRRATLSVQGARLLAVTRQNPKTVHPDVMLRRIQSGLEVLRENKLDAVEKLLWGMKRHRRGVLYKVLLFLGRQLAYQVVSRVELVVQDLVLGVKVSGAHARGEHIVCTHRRASGDDREGPAHGDGPAAACGCGGAASMEGCGVLLKVGTLALRQAPRREAMPYGVAALEASVDNLNLHAVLTERAPRTSDATGSGAASRAEQWAAGLDWPGPGAPAKRVRTAPVRAGARPAFDEELPAWHGACELHPLLRRWSAQAAVRWGVASGTFDKSSPVFDIGVTANALMLTLDAPSTRALQALSACIVDSLKFRGARMVRPRVPVLQDPRAWWQHAVGCVRREFTRSRWYMTRRDKTLSSVADVVSVCRVRDRYVEAYVKWMVLKRFAVLDYNPLASLLRRRLERTLRAIDERVSLHDSVVFRWWAWVTTPSMALLLLRLLLGLPVGHCANWEAGQRSTDATHAKMEEVLGVLRLRGQVYLEKKRPLRLKLTLFCPKVAVRLAMGARGAGNDGSVRATSEPKVTMLEAAVHDIQVKLQAGQPKRGAKQPPVPQQPPPALQGRPVSVDGGQARPGRRSRLGDVEKMGTVSQPVEAGAGAEVRGGVEDEGAEGEAEEEAAAMSSRHRRRARKLPAAGSQSAPRNPTHVHSGSGPLEVSLNVRQLLITSAIEGGSAQAGRRGQPPPPVGARGPREPCVVTLVASPPDEHLPHASTMRPKRGADGARPPASAAARAHEPADQRGAAARAFKGLPSRTWGFLSRSFRRQPRRSGAGGYRDGPQSFVSLKYVVPALVTLEPSWVDVVVAPLDCVVLQEVILACCRFGAEAAPPAHLEPLVMTRRVTIQAAVMDQAANAMRPEDLQASAGPSCGTLVQARTGVIFLSIPTGRDVDDVTKAPDAAARPGQRVGVPGSSAGEDGRSTASGWSGYDEGRPSSAASGGGRGRRRMNGLNHLGYTLVVRVGEVKVETEDITDASARKLKTRWLQNRAGTLTRQRKEVELDVSAFLRKVSAAGEVKALDIVSNVKFHGVVEQCFEQEDGQIRAAKNMRFNSDNVRVHISPFTEGHLIGLLNDCVELYRQTRRLAAAVQPGHNPFRDELLDASVANDPVGHSVLRVHNGSVGGSSLRGGGGRSSVRAGRKHPRSRGRGQDDGARESATPMVAMEAVVAVQVYIPEFILTMSKATEASRMVDLLSFGIHGLQIGTAHDPRTFGTDVRASLGRLWLSDHTASPVENAEPPHYTKFMCPKNRDRILHPLPSGHDVKPNEILHPDRAVPGTLKPRAYSRRDRMKLCFDFWRAHTLETRSKRPCEDVRKGYEHLVLQPTGQVFFTMVLPRSTLGAQRPALDVRCNYLGLALNTRSIERASPHLIQFFEQAASVVKIRDLDKASDSEEDSDSSSSGSDSDSSFEGYNSAASGRQSKAGSVRNASPAHKRALAGDSDGPLLSRMRESGYWDAQAQSQGLGSVAMSTLLGMAIEVRAACSYVTMSVEDKHVASVLLDGVGLRVEERYHRNPHDAQSARQRARRPAGPVRGLESSFLILARCEEVSLVDHLCPTTSAFVLPISAPCPESGYALQVAIFKRGLKMAKEGGALGLAGDPVTAAAALRRKQVPRKVSSKREASMRMLRSHAEGAQQQQPGAAVHVDTELPDQTVIRMEGTNVRGALLFRFLWDILHFYFTYQESLVQLCRELSRLLSAGKRPATAHRTGTPPSPAIELKLLDSMLDLPRNSHSAEMLTVAFKELVMHLPVRTDYVQVMQEAAKTATAPKKAGASESQRGAHPDNLSSLREAWRRVSGHELDRKGAGGRAQRSVHDKHESPGHSAPQRTQSRRPRPPNMPHLWVVNPRWTGQLDGTLPSITSSHDSKDDKMKTFRAAVTHTTARQRYTSVLRLVDVAESFYALFRPHADVARLAQGFSDLRLGFHAKGLQLYNCRIDHEKMIESFLTSMFGPDGEGAAKEAVSRSSTAPADAGSSHSPPPSAMDAAESLRTNMAAVGMAPPPSIAELKLSPPGHLRLPSTVVEETEEDIWSQRTPAGPVRKAPAPWGRNPRGRRTPEGSGSFGRIDEGAHEGETSEESSSGDDLEEDDYDAPGSPGLAPLSPAKKPPVERVIKQAANFSLSNLMTLCSPEYHWRHIGEGGDLSMQILVGNSPEASKWRMTFEWPYCALVFGEAQYQQLMAFTFENMAEPGTFLPQTPGCYYGKKIGEVLKPVPDLPPTLGVDPDAKPSWSIEVDVGALQAMVEQPPQAQPMGVDFLRGRGQRLSLLKLTGGRVVVDEFASPPELGPNRPSRRIRVESDGLLITDHRWAALEPGASGTDIPVIRVPPAAAIAAGAAPQPPGTGFSVLQHGLGGEQGSTAVVPALPGRSAAEWPAKRFRVQYVMQNGYFEDHVGRYDGGGPTTMEVEMWGAELLWPHGPDLSVVHKVQEVFTRYMWKDSVALFPRRRDADQWMFINVVLAHSRIQVPLPAQTRQSIHEAPRLSHRHLALAFDALRVGYHWGGDGQTQLRVDTAKLRGDLNADLFAKIDAHEGGILRPVSGFLDVRWSTPRNHERPCSIVVRAGFTPLNLRPSFAHTQSITALISLVRRGQQLQQEEQERVDEERKQLQAVFDSTLANSARGTDELRPSWEEEITAPGLVRKPMPLKGDSFMGKATVTPITKRGRASSFLNTAVAEPIPDNTRLFSQVKRYEDSGSILGGSLRLNAPAGALAPPNPGPTKVPSRMVALSQSDPRSEGSGHELADGGQSLRRAKSAKKEPAAADDVAHVAGAPVAGTSFLDHLNLGRGGGPSLAGTMGTQSGVELDDLSGMQEALGRAMQAAQNTRVEIMRSESMKARTGRTASARGTNEEEVPPPAAPGAFRPSLQQFVLVVEQVEVTLVDDRHGHSIDVLQAAVSHISVLVGQEQVVPGVSPNRLAAAGLSLHAAFLNSSMDMMENIVEPWRVQLEMRGMGNSQNVLVSSRERLNVLFSPASFQSIGDAMTFANQISFDSADSGNLRRRLARRDTQTRAAGSRGALLSPVLADRGARDAKEPARAHNLYIVKNETGRLLSCWVENPADESVGDAPHIHALRPGAEEPLLQEPKAVHVVLADTQQDVLARTISMQVEGQLNPLTNVVVDKVGTFAYEFDAGTRSDEHMPVVVDVKLEDRTKMLSVHGPFCLLNETNTDLEFRVHLYGAHRRNSRIISLPQSGPLQPGSRCYVPTSLINSGLIYVQAVGYQQAEKDAIRLDYSKPSVLLAQQGLVHCTPQPGRLDGFTTSLSIQKQELQAFIPMTGTMRMRPMYTLVFSAPLVIKNLLPYPVRMQLHERGMRNTQDKVAVESADKLHVTEFDMSHKLYINLSLDPFRSQPTAIHYPVSNMFLDDDIPSVVTRQGHVVEKSIDVSLDAGDGRQMSLRLDWTHNKLANQKTINITCPFWLLNLSGHDIIFKELGSTVERVAPRSDDDLNPEPVLMGVARGNIQFSTKDHAWTKPINVTQIGSKGGVSMLATRGAASSAAAEDDADGEEEYGGSGRELSPPPSDGRKGLRKRLSSRALDVRLRSKHMRKLIPFKRTHGRLDFGVHISVAPKPYDQVKVVTFTPRFFMVNTTNETIHVRQRGCEGRPLVLHPKHETPFHWPDGFGKMAIEVKLDGELQNWAWSGCFRIDQPSDFGVRLRDLSSHEVHILHVVISPVQGSLQVSFISSKNRPVPYRVENRCRKTTIKFRQSLKSPSRSVQWDQVAPGKFMHYAWDFPAEMDRNRLQVEVVRTGFMDASSAVHEYQLDNLMVHPTILQRRIKGKGVGKKQRMGNMASTAVENIYVAVYADDATRVLAFSNDRDILLQRHDENEEIRTQKIKMERLLADIHHVGKQLRTFTHHDLTLLGLGNLEAGDVDADDRFPDHRVAGLGPRLTQVSVGDVMPPHLHARTKSAVPDIARELSGRTFGSMRDRSPSGRSMPAEDDAGSDELPGERQLSQLNSGRARASLQAVQEEGDAAGASPVSAPPDGVTPLAGRVSHGGQGGAAPLVTAFMQRQRSAGRGEAGTSQSLGEGQAGRQLSRKKSNMMSKRFMSMDVSKYLEAGPSEVRRQNTGLRGGRRTDAASSTAMLSALDESMILSNTLLTPTHAPPRTFESLMVDETRLFEDVVRARYALRGHTEGRALPSGEVQAGSTVSTPGSAAGDDTKRTTDLGFLGGELAVRVVRAEGLYADKKGRKLLLRRAAVARDMDVYMKLHCEEQTFKTEVSKCKSGDAEWHEEVVFQTVSNRSDLRIAVYARTVVGADDCVGEVIIPLRDVERTKQRVDGFSVTDLKTYALTKRNAGKLRSDGAGAVLQLGIAWRITPLDKIILKVRSLEEELDARLEILAQLEERFLASNQHPTPQIGPADQSEPSQTPAPSVAPGRSSRQLSPKKLITQPGAMIDAHGMKAVCGQACPQSLQLATSKQGRLEVTVLEARNLTPTYSRKVLRSLYTMDSYVVAHLSTRLGEQTETSKVSRNSMTPVWNESFRFDNATPQDTLELSLWDRRRVGHNVFLGSASVALTQIMDGRPHYTWLALEARREEDKFVTGDLHIRLRWKEEGTDDDLRAFVLELSLASVGVSMVESQSAKLPREVAFMLMEDISAVMRNFKTHEDIRMSISALQVDNQLLSSTHPIILSRTPTYLENVPRMHKLLQRHRHQHRRVGNARNGAEHAGGILPRASTPFLRVWSKRSFANPTIMNFEELTCDIAEVDFVVEEELIDVAISILNSLPVDHLRSEDDAKLQRVGSVRHTESAKLREQLSRLASASHVHTESSSSTRFYFKTLKIDTIKVNLTIVPYAESSQLDYLSQGAGQGLRMFRNFGINLMDINQVPIRIGALVLNNQLMASEELYNTVHKHLSGAALREIYQILGTMEILSPVIMLTELGKGAVALAISPFKALRGNRADRALPSSPVELTDRATGAFKSSLMGLLTALGQFSGGISKGFSLLSGDEQYMLRSRRRPQNTLQGMQYGGQALASGLVDGLTGIVRMPIIGAQRTGFRGFSKGVAKGSLGFVLKPIGGLFELASKTVHGVAQSVQNSGMRSVVQQARNNRKRIRAPISILHRDQIGDNARAIFRQWTEVAGRLKYGRYKDEHVQDFLQNKENKALLLTEKRIIYLNLTRRHVRWTMLYEDITSLETYGLEIIIHGRRHSNKRGSFLALAVPVRRDVHCQTRNLQNSLLVKIMRALGTSGERNMFISHEGVRARPAAVVESVVARNTNLDMLGILQRTPDHVFDSQCFQIKVTECSPSDAPPCEPEDPAYEHSFSSLPRVHDAADDPAEIVPVSQLSTRVRDPAPAEPQAEGLPQRGSSQVQTMTPGDSHPTGSTSQVVEGLSPRETVLASIRAIQALCNAVQRQAAVEGRAMAAQEGAMHAAGLFALCRGAQASVQELFRAGKADSTVLKPVLALVDSIGSESNSLSNHGDLYSGKGAVGISSILALCSAAEAMLVALP